MLILQAVVQALKVPYGAAGQLMASAVVRAYGGSGLTGGFTGVFLSHEERGQKFSKGVQRQPHGPSQLHLLYLRLTAHFLYC